MIARRHLNHARVTPEPGTLQDVALEGLGVNDWLDNEGTQDKGLAVEIMCGEHQLPIRSDAGCVVCVAEELDAEGDYHMGVAFVLGVYS